MAAVYKVEEFDNPGPAFRVVAGQETLEPVAVEASEWGRNVYLHVRKWRFDNRTNRYTRTGKGTAVNMERHEDLLEALAEVVNEFYGYERVKLTVE